MVLLGFLAMLFTCAVALLAGARPERWGAAALGVCWLISMAGQAVLGARSDMPILVADLFYAVALLALAAVFDRGWIWISLVLQAAELAGQVLRLFIPPEERVVCSAFSNMASFAILATLLGGVLIHALERRRDGYRASRRRQRAPG